MVTTLFLFRHGETDWNVQERFQGHLNIPLNENGKGQARALVPQLRLKGIESIISSDLDRTLETAQIIADPLGIPVFQDMRLREANLGEAQGLTRDEIVSRFGPELAQRWRSSKVSDADISYPGGETGSAIVQRVYEALRSFIKQHPFQIIGVSTHGGVIRRVMHDLLPPDSPPVSIPNGIVYKIFYEHTKSEFCTSLP